MFVHMWCVYVCWCVCVHKSMWCICTYMCMTCVCMGGMRPCVCCVRYMYVCTRFHPCMYSICMCCAVYGMWTRVYVSMYVCTNVWYMCCVHPWHVYTHAPVCYAGMLVCCLCMHYASVGTCMCMWYACVLVCVSVYVCCEARNKYEFRLLLRQLALCSWILQCFDTVWNRSFIAWRLLIAQTAFFLLDFSWHWLWHTTLMSRLWKSFFFFFLMRQMCIQLFLGTDVFSW